MANVKRECMKGVSLLLDSCPLPYDRTGWVNDHGAVTCTVNISICTIWVRVANQHKVIVEEIILKKRIYV